MVELENPIKRDDLEVPPFQETPPPPQKKKNMTHEPRDGAGPSGKLLGVVHGDIRQRHPVRIPPHHMSQAAREPVPRKVGKTLQS